MGSSIGKERSKQTAPVKMKNKYLLTLEEKEVESWSIKDVQEWIHKGGFPEEIKQMTAEFFIDGDGILNFPIEQLEIIFKERNWIENPQYSNFLSFFTNKQKEELQKQRERSLPPPNLNELFHPHQLPTETVELIIYYHNVTKHGIESSSRSLNRDWTQQPRIWRRYYGSPGVQLPIPSNEQIPTLKYNQLFDTQTPSSPLNLFSISNLFFYSLAISARKPSWQVLGQPRSAWSKRVNASSGGLHPTGSYIILPSISGIERGIYHYNSKEHTLEKRKVIDSNLWNKFTMNLPENSFFIGLTSVFWREVWKYGERGFRYSHLDIGHAICSIRLAASILGWKMKVIESISDSSLLRILGLHKINFIDKVEKEFPCTLILIIPTNQSLQDIQFQFNEEIVQQITEEGLWLGNANVNSYSHVEWEIVTALSQAIIEPKDSPIVFHFQHASNLSQSLFYESENSLAVKCIRDRRSALDFSGKRISKEKFFQFVARIVSVLSPIPWDCNEWNFVGAIGVFIYRVNELPSGRYMLLRNPQLLDPLKEITQDKGYLWKQSEQIPSEIPLYLLYEEEYSSAGKRAEEVSCFQALVNHAAFCFCMFVDVLSAVQQNISNYRRMHWEGGMIGQVCYNEAMALDLKGTGLGCFLDDPSREAFGLGESNYQPIYHFTAGTPETDIRYPPFNYESSMFDQDEENE